MDEKGARKNGNYRFLYLLLKNRQAKYYAVKLPFAGIALSIRTQSP